jgi:hypothetical protein
MVYACAATMVWFDAQVRQVQLNMQKNGDPPMKIAEVNTRTIVDYMERNQALRQPGDVHG